MGVGIFYIPKHPKFWTPLQIPLWGALETLSLHPLQNSSEVKRMGLEGGWSVHEVSKRETMESSVGSGEVESCVTYTTEPQKALLFSFLCIL